jgi:uncharacterized protein (DUF885 family)
MHKLFARTALILALFALPAYADWIEASDRHAMTLLRALGQLQPESIAGYGLSEFDTEVLDLGAERYERGQALRRDSIATLEAALAAEKDARVRQDLQIMLDDQRNDIRSASLYRDHLLPYYNLHRTLYSSFNSLLDPRNDASRYPAALERLAKYTGVMEGYDPITEQARARSEERFSIDGLLGPYIKQLETDLGKAPGYLQAIGALFERAGLTGWERDFALLEEQLNAYEQWLRNEMLPRARQDNRLPEAIYANNLRNYGVDAAPAELIFQAQYSYQLLRSEMKALAVQIAAKRGWKNDDLVSVIRQLKREQLRPEDVLETYQQRLKLIENIIERENLITLPERDAVIRLATEAEAAAVPASFMSPPQLINNTGQYGEFVLVQKNPALAGEDAVMDDWSHDSIVWALTVHEARPGHELQFATLVENGTSLARAVFAANSANIEGWGLYAESIMHEFLPLEGQLFNLYSRAMRAARMFLDPMVNSGQMSHEGARDFLIEQMALSLPMASSEADRYAFWAPGQATSYYYGYSHLLRLRTEVEIALGDHFDQREFHDFILAQGLLPPELLRAAVLAEFLGKPS